MTICKTAYDTAACSGTIVTKIVEAIEDANVSGNIPRLSSVRRTDGGLYIMIIDGRDQGKPIPAFMHPVIVQNSNDNPDKTVVAIDLRSCVRWDSDKWENVIRNNYEFDFLSAYAMLNYMWLNDNPKLLLSMSILPISLYSRWMSENITRRFGLNPQDQMTIAAIAAFYYICQFTDETEVDQNDIKELQRIVGLVSKATYTNAEQVLSIIENIPLIKNVDEFCEAIKTATGNIRLNDLNKGLLFSILGGTWYGNNARELTAVAIEFPPAWILLTYASYKDRSYKNTSIAKMSARDKKQDIDLFFKSIANMFVSD